MGRKIDKLVIHCTATPADMDIGVKEVRKWHMDKGWADIGYHFLIRRDGTVEKGRDAETPGAHVEGHNRFSLGVSMAGGCERRGKGGPLYAVNNFTPAQFEALRLLVASLWKKYPTIKITCGHRDLNPGKECPSFSVKDKLNEWGMGGVWK